MDGIHLQIGSYGVVAGNTLATHVASISDSDDFSWVTHKLLNDFWANIYQYGSPAERSMLLTDPPPLRCRPEINVFVTALAIHLATSDQLPIPEWADEPRRARRLKEAFYLGNANTLELQAKARRSTPSAFADVNIFIDDSFVHSSTQRR